MNERKKYNNFVGKVWDFWEKRSFGINSVIAMLFVYLYWNGNFDLIRENAGNLIAYSIGLMTLNGVFMTLLVTLKESPVFERLRKHFPQLHDDLYEGLKNQVARSIYFIFLNLIISIVGVVSNVFVAYTGLIIWSYLLSDITLGTLYNLRVVKRLVEAKVDTKKKMI